MAIRYKKRSRLDSVEVETSTKRYFSVATMALLFLHFVGDIVVTEASLGPDVGVGTAAPAVSSLLEIEAIHSSDELALSGVLCSVSIFKVGVDADVADKTERKHLLVHTNQIFVALAHGDRLRVGVHNKMPRGNSVGDTPVGGQCSLCRCGFVSHTFRLQKTDVQIYGIILKIPNKNCKILFYK